MYTTFRTLIKCDSRFYPINQWFTLIVLKKNWVTTRESVIQHWMLHDDKSPIPLLLKWPINSNNTLNQVFSATIYDVGIRNNTLDINLGQHVTPNDNPHKQVKLVYVLLPFNLNNQTYHTCTNASHLLMLILSLFCKTIFIQICIVNKRLKC